MSGLYHTLNIGAESLFATRQGVDTAGHNIANAQTEGYSRQRVDITQRHPSEMRGVVIGNGVFVKNITRAHDQFLEKHINQTAQDTGYSQKFFNSVKALEDIYSPELNASVADEVGVFFSRMRELGNYPEDITIRTSVQESAESVSRSFRRVDDELRRAQVDFNDQILGEVGEINTLVEGIAELNIAIQSTEAGPDRSANDLRDQQDRMLRELNSKVEINYYRGDLGMVVVRGPGETLLVDRGHHRKFDTILKKDSPNFWDIVVVNSAGRAFNVSEINAKGRLKALFEVRDGTVENLLRQNNEMAYTLANTVNQVHRRGFGLNDYKHSTGRNLFQISDAPHLAARTIGLSDEIQLSTDAISAAATPDSPGDNVIANNILRLENEKVLLNGNATFNEYYANYIGVFGLEVVRAEHAKEADSLLMADLQKRREAVAGVSMDEEAMNLLRWQANFTASSRVITTVDEMLETVLSLKR